MGGKVGEEHAGRAKHGEASVHQLSLHIPGEVLGLLAKAKGIEAEVTNQAAGTPQDC